MTSCNICKRVPMPYMTIEDTIGNTPLVQLVRLPGADARARNNIILGKMEGNNPAGSVKDRAAMSMLQARRGARPDQAGRHPDRGDQRQHRHRAGDGGRDPRLQDGAADARQPVDRAAPEHGRLRRPDHPDARKRAAWNMRATWPSRCSATARASSSTSSPTPTIRAPTTKAPARKSGATPKGASPISSAPWAPPAPSWACRNT